MPTRVPLFARETCVIGTRPALPRLARPRAPVTARAHEVAVRSTRLLQRSLAVPEQAPFARPHLEEAQVLTVLGVGREARLAPRDPESLPAIPAEDMADRPSRVGVQRRQVAFVAPLRECTTGLRGLRLRGAEVCARVRELRLRDLRKARVGEHPPVVFEEPDHRFVLVHGGELSLELDRGIGGCRACDDRSETEQKGAQAQANGFQDPTSIEGTRPRRDGSRSNRSTARQVRRSLLSFTHGTREDGWPGGDAYGIFITTRVCGVRGASCGTGTRTPTSGARIRRPTIRRSRRARPDDSRPSGSIIDRVDDFSTAGSDVLGAATARAGTPGRGASRRRSRRARSPRRTARAPSRASSP